MQVGFDCEEAVWLRNALLEIATTLYSDRRPVVVRQWTDPVHLHDPEPVGHRFLFLVAVGGDDRPASPDIDDVVDAFRAAGWEAHEPRHGREPGTGWAEARREDFKTSINAGAGPGVLTFTGWTPVVFTTGRQLRQPQHTLSTVYGVLCRECHGWGACLDCDGSGRSTEPGSYGRCWCHGGQGGPGACIECGLSGEITESSPSHLLKRYGFADADAPDADADGPDAFRMPPIEKAHDSNIDALTDVAHRPCACGEFRSRWSNHLSEADDHLVSLFTGRCQGCAKQRAYAFMLPDRKLPPPPPPPSPPPCPRCAQVPVPLVRGLNLPGSATMRALDLGLVAASNRGCEVRPDDPNWRCPACGHAWQDADERRRARVLRSILADLPSS
ncbi:hypothetical protein [Actinoallomurus sp. NPDC050550]|uniref:hypothetical protein n=1 Tax=Actinoallomurus sp. NPDC050550 TaxID=3154937 RepID=UPI0033E0E3C4